MNNRKKFVADLRLLCLLQKVFLESEYITPDVDATTDKKGAVEKSVLKELFSLLAIDPRKTATVIYYHMYPYIPLVLSKLESSKKDLYNFLKSVLDLRESGSQPNSPVKTSSRWKDEDVLSSHATYETFIELMCQFEPKRVAAYLKSKTSHFHNQKVLKICQNFGLVDAQAFILEEEGQVDEAFNLMKQGDILTTFFTQELNIFTVVDYPTELENQNNSGFHSSKNLSIANCGHKIV